MSAPDWGRREGKNRMGRTVRVIEHFGVCLRPGIQIERLNEQLVQSPGVKPKFAGALRQRENSICRYKFAVGLVAGEELEVEHQEPRGRSALGRLVVLNSAHEP
jgi:hypothetical protein